MGKTMTDQEFSLLKNKIQLTERYNRYLNRLYEEQTGQKFHPSGPMCASEMVQTIELVKEELAEARGL
jgi:hypothetical protein